MSARDVQRIQVLSEVMSGHCTIRAAASVLAVTPRHARRLLVRLQTGGGAGLAHKARGCPPNNRIDGGLRDHMLALVRNKYADFGPTLVAEMLEQHQRILLFLPGGCTIKIWTQTPSKPRCP